jgi:hypothetical protein
VRTKDVGPLWARLGHQCTKGIKVNPSRITERLGLLTALDERVPSAGTRGINAGAIFIVPSPAGVGDDLADEAVECLELR